MKKFTSVLIIYFLSTVIVYAQPGTLDKTFGDNGKKYYADLHGECLAVAIQPDDKIIVGGLQYGFDLDQTGFLMIRFNTDGTMDETFGSEGKVFLHNLNGSEAYGIKSLALQPDKKIIACARFVTTSPFGDIGLVRLNPDGSLDSSFGENGVVVVSIGKDDKIGGMVLQPDGKIVVAGKKGVEEFESSPDFVTRFLPDGKQDKSFGKDGIVISDFSSLSTIGALLLQPDGKILTGGKYGTTTELIQVVRYAEKGTIDSTFGTNGRAWLFPEEADTYSLELNDMTLQPDGSILCAGSGGNYQMMLAKFDAKGFPDRNFGDKKSYTILPQPEEGVSGAKTVRVTSDNKIIITGRYFINPDINIAAVRYNSNGFLDSSFGENGIATAGFGDMFYGSAMEAGKGAIQKDGKIIVGGSFEEVENIIFTIGLVRFNNDEGVVLPKYVQISSWPGHHGFIWNDYPGHQTKYYGIERSSNGSTFNEIAQITSNSNQQAYSYEDMSAAAGTSYYRLRTVSADGSAVYSNTLPIEAGKAAFKAYPNPAKDMLHIEGLPINGKTKLTVIDFSGNSVASATTSVGSFEFNIGKLAPGNYILRIITNDGTTLNKRFVKQ